MKQALPIRFQRIDRMLTLIVSIRVLASGNVLNAQQNNCLLINCENWCVCIAPQYASIDKHILQFSAKNCTRNGSWVRLPLPFFNGIAQGIKQLLFTAGSNPAPGIVQGGVMVNTLDQGSRSKGETLHIPVWLQFSILSGKHRTRLTLVVSDKPNSL